MKKLLIRVFLKDMEKGKYWLSMPLKEPPSVMHAFCIVE
jgi:hypothetical protein